MRFSIIIPVFNVAEYLDECLMSVCNQDCKDFEIIIIDDGSSDNSLGICQKYECEHKNLKIISKQNEGVTKARFSGALVAEGDYIINLDGDDMLFEHTLTDIMKIVDSTHPDVVFFDLESFGNGSKNICHNTVAEGLYEGAEVQRIIEGYIYDKSLPGLNCGNILPSAGGKVIKRELYIESLQSASASIFQGEDLVQNLEVLLHSQTVYVLHKCYYKYRIRERSVSNNVTLDYLDNAFCLYNLLITRYPNLSNQLSAYLIIRIWNITAKIFSKNTPFNDVYLRLCELKFLSYKKQLRRVKWGRLTIFEKIKVFVVTERSWLAWIIILNLKY